MTTLTTPTDIDTADLLNKAGAVISRNRLHKGFLWDTKQEAAGLPIELCRVNIFGALNIAAHGTPRHHRTPIVYAAERALQQRIGSVPLAVWGDQAGREADDAIVLLLSTAASLREAAA